MDGTLNAAAGAAAVPPLRQDLRLVEGAPDTSGQRIWMIHDPLAQRFFEIDQDAVDLLACWQGATPASLAERLARMGRDEPQRIVGQLLQFLEANELLAPRPQASFARVRAAAQAGRPPLWKRALHGYLFIRIPLARPDRFLRRTLPLVSWAFRPGFWIVVALAGMAGLYLVSQQWEAFLGTFPGMLDLGGIATYGACLVLVKALHELGHGYTAVRLGARVPTMGVALLVMAPVLYTDTTDAWRLRDRRQRVLIDVAGMVVELLVAVVATLAWVFLPDGPLRSAAFALATTGWVMSVAINVNPLLRFDGYYLLGDLAGVANLQERSFGLARWHLRELLFGFGDAPPEAPAPLRRFAFIAYAWCAWIYRFFLFLGIALLVYHYFFKLLGIFLFAVEIGWFIVLPIGRELAVWWQRRGHGAPRARWTFIAAGALFVALGAPWPSTVRIPAVLAAAQEAPAYAPQAARIERVLASPGRQVRAGELLLSLSAPALEDALARARENAAGLQERLARRGADPRDLSDSLVLARQLRLEQDRIAGLQREKARLQVKAPIAGTVIEVAPELHPGRWVDGRMRLVLLARPGTLQAHGYLDGNELARIAEGREGRFVDESRLLTPLPMRVRRIAGAATESVDELLLGSTAGGLVPVRREGRDGRLMRPEYAAFEIVAEGERPERLPLTELRGELQVRGDAQSLALRALRRVVQILVRETVL